MRTCLLAASVFLAAAVQDAPPDDVALGTVGKTARGWSFTPHGSTEPVPLQPAPGCPSPAGFLRKRVQLLGGQENGTFTAKLIDEIRAADHDLVISATGRAERLRLMEFQPVAAHRHPGRTCRSHAWTRAVVAAKEGRAAAEWRTPAYASRSGVLVFVRAEGRDGSRDSRDVSFDGTSWVDPDLKPVDSPLTIQLDAP